MKSQDYTKPEVLTKTYGIDLNRPLILFTQHSVTTEMDEAVAQVRPSLAALKQCLARGYQVVMTYPNSDAGGLAILEEMKIFFQSNHGTDLHFESSLGRSNYHGFLALAKLPNTQVVCVGNSSSGLKETPEFFCPAVNIGPRQKGRLRGENVIDTDYNELAILGAIEKAFSADFKTSLVNMKNPYGEGTAGKKVAQFLSELALGKKLIQKAMCLKGLKQNGWYC